MKRLLIAAVMVAACVWPWTALAAQSSGATGGPAAEAPLRVAVMSIRVLEVHPGYVRVEEILSLKTPRGQTFVGEVTFGVPAAARYITFLAGLKQPRVDGQRIVDRLTVTPGFYPVAFGYAVAGSGDLDLSRPSALPIDTLEVFVRAPVQIHSSQLVPRPPAVDATVTIVQAEGFAIPPGVLDLRLGGVPAARRWPAPAAAGALAALLAAGLIWAAVSHDRKRRG